MRAGAFAGSIVGTLLDGKTCWRCSRC